MITMRNIFQITAQYFCPAGLSAEREQELAKFSTQLVRARQGELQGQLMQALREKAQIEINNTFINQDDSEEGAAH